MSLSNNDFLLKVPEKLQGREPYMFLEWYKKRRISRWIEYDRRNNEAIKLCSPLTGKRILDIGCAWGYSAMRLNSLGVEAYGVDIDKEALVFGREMAKYNGYQVVLRYANAKELPFPCEFFDSIICVETLEHIPVEDRAKALKEMERTVKINGKIIISTPNPVGIAEIGKGVFGKITLFRNIFPASYRSHPQSYTFETGDRMVDILVTEKNMKEYTKRLGLRISEWKTIVFILKITPDFCFFPLVWIERILENLPFLNKLGCTKIYIIQKNQSLS